MPPSPSTRQARSGPDPSSRVAIVLAFVLTIGSAGRAAAQTSPFTLDIVGAVDAVHDSTPRRETQLWVDVFAAVRIADGVDLVARPVVSRRAFDGAWQKHMYQLGVRYERPATTTRGLGVRVEAGQLPSPIGIAMLENRADLNPVVSQHSAYYMPLPRVSPEIPRTFLIAGAYPFGAQATLSSRRWDARVAAIDSSPVRGRPMLGANKPPRLLNVVAGVGVTPRVGVRLGAAVARGAYASVREVADPLRGDRDATMMQVEGEWSFGYTRIVGEWIHSVLETSRADASAHGYWIEATRTLTPRLFVATRFDSQAFEYQRPGVTTFSRQTYNRFEANAGVRVSPDLTLRAGYLGREGYVVFHWDDQFIASVVWQKRIW